MSKYILAIDQGTTSTRAMLFDEHLCLTSSAQRAFNQSFPKPGWVEHDPNDLWRTSLQTCLQAIKNAQISPCEIVGIGIANQRETTLLWNKKTGLPIYSAIIWQDRRTTELCHKLKKDNLEPLIKEKTGLLLDPYFSATKIAWILDNIEGARAAAIAGELAFGTVDSYLIYKLTGGKKHVTDATNASRTLLYNIHNSNWDQELLDLFQVPKSILPEVMDCADNFGAADPGLFGFSIPISGVAGDQQAAAIGQACFKPGMLKSTYGTGCFALLNTGKKAIRSQHSLLTTIAYSLEGNITYALEGSIFVAGATIQWLCENLGIIDTASQSEQFAAESDPSQPIYIVPAFTGLGAPYWDPQARGAIYGLTRETGPKELARAALESVGYQTQDLLQAMKLDWNNKDDTQTILRVDGGMVKNDWMMQFLADILDAPVERPKSLETTAIGAAYLAGYQHAFYPNLTDFGQHWERDKRFEPMIKNEDRIQKYNGWKMAVARTLSAS